MTKVFVSADAAVSDLPDGASLAVGGFGVCGVPMELVAAVRRLGTGNLHVVSNNCGIDGWGLSVLLEEHRIAKLTISFAGGNEELVTQFLAGDVEVEFTPQGTLAERLRAAGAGIPAFYTATGIGTQVEEGGMPTRYDRDGRVLVASNGRAIGHFGGRPYLLEEALHCDYALVHAAVGDRHGNLVFAKSARNFNPLCAMAATTTIAQVERLVEPGELDPDAVHLPGIFVHRVVEVGTAIDKPIEIRAVQRTGAH